MRACGNRRLPATLALAASGLIVVTVPVGACGSESPGASGCRPPPAASRLSGTLGGDPSGGRIAAHAAGLPWIAQAWAPMPVALTGSDHAISIATSTRHLRSVARRRLQDKIEAARLLAPDGFKFPELDSVPATKLDVWGGLDVTNPDGNAALTGRVGVDVAASRSTTVGVMVDVAEEADAALFDQRTGAAAYIILRAPSVLTFDATAHVEHRTGDWSETAIDGLYGVVTARLTGEFRVGGGVRLRPRVTVSSGAEAIEAGGDVARAVGHSLSFEPEITRTFKLEDGAVVTPKLELKADETSVGRVGGGVTLSKPGDYSLGISSAVGPGRGDGARDLEGRLQLGVPLQ